MKLLDHLYWQMSTEVGRHIVALLTRDASLWHSENGYWLEHETADVAIWIANKDYGLRVIVGGGLRSVALYPPMADRVLIWRQVRRMKIPTPDQFQMNSALSHLAQQTEGRVIGDLLHKRAEKTP